MFFCFVGSDTFCALSGLIFSFFFVVFFCLLWGWAGTGKSAAVGKQGGQSGEARGPCPSPQQPVPLAKYFQLWETREDSFLP